MERKMYGRQHSQGIGFTRTIEWDSNPGHWVEPYREPIGWQPYVYRGSGKSDPVLDNLFDIEQREIKRRKKKAQRTTPQRVFNRPIVVRNVNLLPPMWDE